MFRAVHIFADARPKVAAALIATMVLSFLAMPAQAADSSETSLTLGAEHAWMMPRAPVLPEFLGHDGYDPVGNALALGLTPEIMDARFDCAMGVAIQCQVEPDHMTVSSVDAPLRGDLRYLNPTHLRRL